MPDTIRDGVSLHYQIAGTGPAVVLIHGNSCDSSFFSPQAARFADRYTVLSVDLRGHGHSGKPDDAYSLATFADDLLFILDGLKISRAALIGHSLGGIVAVETALRRQNLAACVAALDSALLAAPGRHGRMTALLSSLSGPDYQKYLLRYFESAFAPEDDPDLRRRILEKIAATPKHVAVSLFAQAGHFDGEAALSSLAAPLLYLAASRPRIDLARLADLKPGAAIGQVVGSGHFMQLTVPDQVNAMLERFLEMVGNW